MRDGGTPWSTASARIHFRFMESVDVARRQDQHRGVAAAIEIDGVLDPLLRPRLRPFPDSPTPPANTTIASAFWGGTVTCRGRAAHHSKLVLNTSR